MASLDGVMPYLELELSCGSDILPMPLSDLVKRLIAARAALPNRSGLTATAQPFSFSRLDDAICPLWQMQRDMEILLPGDVQLPPSAYDVLLSDLKPDDLPGIVSRTLGVPYLSASTTDAVWPIVGRVYGIKRRVLFTLPVSLQGGGKCVNTHFIFDTGAPATYLASSTIAALGLEEWQLGSAAICINGCQTSSVLVSDTIRVSHPGGSLTDCHFSGLNLMGMDFIERAGATLSVDMVSKEASITRGRSPL